MELRQLETFRVVAKTMSFTRAATTLNYAQSSVSAQIQSLEDELEVTLFDRLGRRTVMTDAGERLLRYADQMLELAKEAQIAVSSGTEPAGTLTISAPETLCAYRLPPVLQRFRQEYPLVDLVFKPMAAASDWEDQLSEGAVDAMIMIDAPLRSPSAVVELLVVEPMRMVTYPDHPLFGLSKVRPADLRGETMLLTEAGCSYRAIFERLLHKDKTYLSSILEFHSVEAIKQCTMGGLGIAVLPEVAVTTEVAAGRLAILPYDMTRCRVETQLAWHKDKWLSPALQAFLKVTRDCLSTEQDQAAKAVEIKPTKGKVLNGHH